MYSSLLKNARTHIWSCWQDGKKLNFQSDNYAFNLMPPFFDPGPIDNPDIRISISAVNPYMLALAGELCGGVVLHSFITSKYTEEVVIPNLQKGASKSGRSLDDINIEESVTDYVNMWINKQIQIRERNAKNQA